jgi:predicted SprT family Zn-dependent metalloprotease
LKLYQGWKVTFAGMGIKSPEASRYAAAGAQPEGKLAMTNLPPAVAELYSLYQSFNLKYFAGILPDTAHVTIEYSSRLTASAGICYTKRRVIRLSTHYHEKHPQDAAVTLLHEMIHLIVPGHGPAFKAWIQKINSMGGKVTLRSMERATKAVYRWKYSCTKCGKEFFKKRRLKNRGKYYACGSCKGSLQEYKLN